MSAQPWFTMRFDGSALLLLDQRRLPGEEAYLTLHTPAEVAEAIEDLAVRGAPAIGCAAAFGVALAALRESALDAQDAALDAAFARLAQTRPTAVNLFWALGRMRETWRTLRASADGGAATAASVAAGLGAAAQGLLEEDVATCRAIGCAGVNLIPQGARILTHCNAGALATGGYGTALGVVRAARDAGRAPRVFADETRPFLQGARLTAWELDRDGIPVTVIADSMAGHLMARGEVDLVVVGADRIARNGDVANKIGTYALAILARAHELPFYVAAPTSTIDFDTPDGASIPIEERSRDEMARLGGAVLLPDRVPVRHPAFDITPHRLVTAIVSERGVARPPYTESLRAG